MDESELIQQIFGEPEEDAEAIERARMRLVRAIRSEEDRARHRRRHHLLLPAAALVAIATSVAVVVALIGPMGGSTAGATELRRLARIASSTQAPDVGRGEYLFLVSDQLRQESTTPISGTGSAYTVLSRLHLRTWIARDGSTSRVTEVISSRFASEADRRAWEAAGRPEVPRAGDETEETFRPGEGYWVDLSTVPRAPAELLTALRAGQIVPRPPDDEQVFLLIGELLAQGDAPPDLRASLLEAAVGLGEVQEVGDVTDPLGRGGRALAVDGSSLRTQLIFDPATAELLAIELYELDGSVDVPRSWMAFQPATIVGSAPEF